MYSSNLYKWIRTNWGQIWGHDRNHGFYVVVPVDVLAEHFGCSANDIIYGEEE